MVNSKRRPRGFEPVSYSSLGLRRTPVKVYMDEERALELAV
jgi:hypothetical protein